jgi:glycosyltransferase involved in cell wall biosynthesis
MSPLISIIIPIYNAERYLHQCIGSILDQTYQNIEIILVNDGSLDQCPTICDEYAAQDDRVTVIHKENGGVSSARNAGIAAAKGEWISFVDADDWIEPDMIELLLSATIQNDNIDIAIGNYFCNYEKKQIAMSPLSNSSCYLIAKNDLITSSLCGSGLDGINIRTPWGKLYRRCLFASPLVCFKPYLSMGEDMVFNLYATMEARSISVQKEAYYHYRINDSSLCNKFAENTIQREEALLEECDLFVRRFDNENFIFAYYSCLIRSIMVCCSSYFFHINNPHPRSKRLKELKQLLTKEPFSAALNNSSNPYLTTKQQLIKFFAKR